MNARIAENSGLAEADVAVERAQLDVGTAAVDGPRHSRGSACARLAGML
jgi:hypothetical protein